ncbi:hypothetical protein HDG37_003585 [Paraburkholderia sp. MM5384-R2]|nr:hypothetical protein [Paraburkholderia sp. MM5384-R2]
MVRGGGRTIAFRSDMDALPAEEEGRPLHGSCDKSRFMAGHDRHMAMLPVPCGTSAAIVIPLALLRWYPSRPKRRAQAQMQCSLTDWKTL